MDEDSTNNIDKNIRIKYIDILAKAASLKDPRLSHKFTPNIRQPIKDNNQIICTKPGFQVCVYQFHKSPEPDRIYKVDGQNNMVEIEFQPGELYQADRDRKLILIGIFPRK
jgi:hypothetical protein